MLPIRAVLFDLDDTLLQTIAAKWGHHKYTARESFGVELTDEVLHEHWGKPLSVMVQELYQHADTPEALLAANLSTGHLFPKDVFVDSVDVVTTLLDRGLEIGIITSTLTENALDDLRRHQFPVDQLFLVQGEDAHSAHKPDPRVFDPALARLSERGISPSEVIYVGDSLIDLTGAQAAGLRFFGVGTGLFDAASLLGAGADGAGPGIASLLAWIDAGPQPSAA